MRTSSIGVSLSTIQTNERICLYGPMGGGKSWKMCQLVEGFTSLCEDNFAYILGTNEGLDKTIQQFPEMQELDRNGRLRYFSIVGTKESSAWDKVLAAVAGIAKEAQVNDVIVVDRATPLWQNLPDYWCWKTYQKSAKDVQAEWVEERKRLKKSVDGNALLKDYGTGINPIWYRMIDGLLDTGANVIIVAGEKELRDKEGDNARDAQDIVANFSLTGTKPDMQADTWSKFDTIMHCSQAFHKDWRVSTVREKGDRKLYSREKVGHMGVDYLLGRAGWEPR